MTAPRPQRAPRGIVDALGRAHEAPGRGARVVSLVPSLTELMVDLGLAALLVGRTGFCIHPRTAVRQIPKVGGTKDLKRARIVDIAPTHALVNVDENRREDAAWLEAQGIEVIATHPLGPEDNHALYDLCGRLFDATERATALSRRLDAAFARLGAVRGPPLPVLYVIWREPWMTVSADTYIARMLALAGLEAVAVDSDARYPVVDERAWRVAQAVLLSSEPYPFRERHVDEAERLARTGTAVRLVDGELLSWYGSRAIAGVDYVSRLGHSLRENLQNA